MHKYETTGTFREYTQIKIKTEKKLWLEILTCRQNVSTQKI